MHVVRNPTSPFEIAGGRLRVHQVPAAPDNLIWLIEGVGTGLCAAVDGPDVAGVLAACDTAGLQLTVVLNTHTHHDHIGINQDLQRRGLLEGLRVVGPSKVAARIPGLSEGVGDGSVIALFGVELQVWQTEGHLDGHVSYIADGAVFCGDTLFAGGCGYLFDGPPATMFASLMRLASLPPDTRVCCAHEYTQDNLRFAWSIEPDNAALAERIRTVWALRAAGGCAVPSTIADERATNPFLRPGSPGLRREVATAMSLSDTASAAEVFAATRALKDRKTYRTNADRDLPIP